MSKENMELWKRVCQTDEAFTKQVSTRGGFTTINAMYRVEKATEIWGPYGDRWGLMDLNYTLIEVMGKEGNPVYEMALDAVFYYPASPPPEMPPGAILQTKPGAGPGPKTDVVFTMPHPSFPISVDMAYRPGNDTRKKLQTDATTKALSKLGFDALIYMGDGVEDDDKYTKAPGKTPGSATAVGDDIFDL